MTINATMINEQADGISDESPGQRAKFSARFGNKGASRDLSTLFPTGPLANISPDQSAKASFDQTKDMFLKELYTNGIVNGEDYHPDFPGGYSAESYTYQEGKALLVADLEAEDLPSRKGPNLKVPTIDTDGQPIVDAGHDRVTPTGGQFGDGKGFGTTLPRNTPGVYSQPSSGRSYIERKDSTDEEVAPTLGEYINTDIYDYTG